MSIRLEQLRLTLLWRCVDAVARPACVLLDLLEQARLALVLLRADHALDVADFCGVRRGAPTCIVLVLDFLERLGLAALVLERLFLDYRLSLLARLLEKLLRQRCMGALGARAYGCWVPSAASRSWRRSSS